MPTLTKSQSSRPDARLRVSCQETLDQDEVDNWRKFLRPFTHQGAYCDPGWIAAQCDGLKHRPLYLSAYRDEALCGVLPLAFVSSRTFGRFLVSLPYVNWAGAIASDEAVLQALIDEAVRAADRLDARQLQLRSMNAVQHPALTHQLASKVQMRLELAPTIEQIWKGLRSVVRTQIRKAEKQQLAVCWGSEELLGDFYEVFSRNMRDLGTPVFGKKLFENILSLESTETELCIIKLNKIPIAAALVVHGPGLTEAPSAGALRKYRSTAANSLLYWQLVKRAAERGQRWFDFGRSSIGGPTFDFKKKWGAQPMPVVWQMYLRNGGVADLRPESGRFKLAIRLWQRLPLSVTRFLGPSIVRGIP